MTVRSLFFEIFPSNFSNQKSERDNTIRLRRSWLAGGFGIALLINGFLNEPLRAADFTIKNGETVTTTQTLDTDETGLVETGGSLNVSGADGISVAASATDVSIRNEGQLVFDSLTFGGIRSGIGARLSLENSGTILLSDSPHRTTIDGGYFEKFVNSGTVIATDGTAIGNFGGGEGFQALINHGDILADGHGILTISIEELINTGRIIGDVNNTGNPARVGVSAFFNISILNNSGLIEGSDGINAAEITNVNNSGTIRGLAQEGIDIQFGTINNSGLIEGPTGIVMDRSFATGNGTIVNAGTIRSTNGPAGIAIDFQHAGDDHLDLRRGNSIEGKINLGAGTDTLTIDPALELRYTFDSLPEIIDARGTVVVTQGNKVLTVANARTGDSHRIVADLTRGIGNSLATRIRSLRRRPSHAVSTASIGTQPNYLTGPSDDVALSLHNTSVHEQIRGQIWAEAFGSTLKTERSASRTASSQQTAGLVTGMDAPVHGGLIAGGYLGAGRSILTAENYERSETDSFFTGLFGSLGSSRGSIDLALTAGWTTQSEKKRILNNLAPGGIEKIDVDKSGWFIALEIGVTRTLPQLGLTVSLRGRYTAQFMEDYNQGGTDPMRVRKRTVQQVFGRAEIARPFDNVGEPGLHSHVIPYGGIEMIHLLDGDSLDISVLGQNHRLNLATEENESSAFAGLRMEARLSDKLSLNADLEARFSDRNERALSANFGGKWRF